MSSTRDVLVVTGTGGIGRAITLQLGAGRTVLLGDRDPDALEAARLELADQGLEVLTRLVDVVDAASVRTFAETAAGLGPVRMVAHTAGVSPEQASPADVLKVDLQGTARVLDEFGRVVAAGGAGVVIASMAGHMGLTPLAKDQEVALGLVPADDLLDLALTHSPELDGPTAYGFAKQANLLRVRAAATVWGARGARVNSISPGIVATPMGRKELTGQFGSFIRKLADESPSGRLGTARDIAWAAEFLLDPRSSYVTGTDLLVDGGVMAGLHPGGALAQ